MPSAKTRTSTSPEQQDIELLKKRFNELDKKKTQAETKLDESQRRLDELKRQARDQYGTDDLDELKKKLQAMKAENERLQTEYQQHLDGIEAELDRVTAEHKAAMSEDELS